MKAPKSEIKADDLVEGNDPAKTTTVVLEASASVQCVAFESLVSDALTPNERLVLEYWERDIRNNLTSFLRAGKALAQIRDKRLYREKYGTFEEYCDKKWQLSRAHAYRLIGEAEVDAHLSPIGDIQRPANESQFRELVGLTPEQIPRAWKNALNLAGDTPMTAKMIREAAAEFKIANKSHKQSSNSCIEDEPVDGKKPGVQKDENDCVSSGTITIQFKKFILRSEDDVDAYLAALKIAYMKVIKGGKGVTLSTDTSHTRSDAGLTETVVKRK